MSDIGKWFLNSKTLWFNILALAVGIAQAFGFAGFTADPQIAEYITVGVAVINIILRFVTKQPVSLSKPITFGDLKTRSRK
jgi:hypothetical protein